MDKTEEANYELCAFIDIIQQYYHNTLHNNRFLCGNFSLLVDVLILSSFAVEIFWLLLLSKRKIV